VCQGRNFLKTRPSRYPRLPGPRPGVASVCTYWCKNAPNACTSARAKLPRVFSPFRPLGHDKPGKLGRGSFAVCLPDNQESSAAWIHKCTLPILTGTAAISAVAMFNCRDFRPEVAASRRHSDALSNTACIAYTTEHGNVALDLERKIQSWIVPNYATGLARAAY